MTGPVTTTESLLYQIVTLRSALAWCAGHLEEREGKVPPFIAKALDATDPTRSVGIISRPEGGAA